MSATRPPMHDDRTTGTSDAASRRGAHRARTKPFSAGLPVLAGIVVILLVVGGIYYALGNGGNSPSSDDTSAAAEPTTTENLPSAASTTAGAPAGDTPATSTSTKPDDPATTTGSADPANANVDKTVSIVVLNSTGIKGLASRGESTLESKGWKVTRTGNSINQGLSVTKIYYGNANREETADAVRTDLGYGQVFQDSSVTKTGVTVVLGHDAE